VLPRPPRPAASRKRDRPGPIEVGEHDIALANDGSHRDVHRQVRALVAGALPTATGTAVLGAERSALAKAGQRRVRRVRDDEHITAAPSVTAVRAAVGNVLLVAKADSAPPA
jgi:hypothetical protein